MAKILIVDDSPTETYKLTNILEKNSHSVLSAETGEQGVSLAKTEQPDVVLMDIVMPGLNGFQATRQLSRGIITKQTDWPVRLAATGQTIAAGTVTLVSPRFDIRLCKRGWLLCLDSPWQDQYGPSIDRLATAIAQLYRQNCGAIIFTGMGDDGSKGCQTIKDRGGLVWVQKPEGCTAPAMPTAVLSSSKVDFIGTVAQLADKIKMETLHMEACSQ